MDRAHLPRWPLDAAASAHRRRQPPPEPSQVGAAHMLLAACQWTAGWLQVQELGCRPLHCFWLAVPL
jgi:hypothetical protein